MNPQCPGCDPNIWLKFLAICDDQERLIRILPLVVTINPSRILLATKYRPQKGNGDIIVDALDHAQEAANTGVHIVLTQYQISSSSIVAEQEGET